MDRMTIDIPAGLSEEQKADLAGWLSDLARQVAGSAAAIDADPAVRAEVLERIRRGLADADEGRVCDHEQAMRRIAGKHGLTLPA